MRSSTRGGRQVGDVVDEDVFLGERGHEFVVPAFVLDGDEFAHALAGGGDDLGGGEVVRADEAGLVLDLLLEARNADFKELV